MSAHAFITPGAPELAAANDHGAPLAPVDVRNVPAGVRVAVRSLGEDTLYHVAAGLFEFMVAGAAAPVGEGGHVRVPAGVPHAWRNAGHALGTLHVRGGRPLRTGMQPRLVTAIGRG